MIQYSWACVSRRSMAGHAGAVADASPYLGSISPVVMLRPTRSAPATHRRRRTPGATAPLGGALGRRRSTEQKCTCGISGYFDLALHQVADAGACARPDFLHFGFAM